MGALGSGPLDALPHGIVRREQALEQPTRGAVRLPLHTGVCGDGQRQIGEVRTEGVVAEAPVAS